MSLFDSYIIVDWSASNTPKRGKDSIWIGAAGAVEILENPRTRAAAIDSLAKILAREADARRRALVGFDFAFGYPCGTARALGLPGDPWRSMWSRLRGAIEDDEKNRSNRFQIAAQLNRELSGGRGPFWGCPKRWEHACLGPRKVDASPADLPDFRICEKRTRGPQPVWKLFTAGAVGSQALVGIPRVAELHGHLAGRAAVWPFETGLKVPVGRQVVLAEVYPSLARLSPTPGQVKDSQQVQALARLFAAWDCAGELAPYFAGPRTLTSEQRRIVEDEEGWILGVL